MSLGISYGETQAQKDAFRSFASKIEADISNPDARAALIAEINGADLQDYDRAQLLGWIDQYRVDFENAAAIRERQAARGLAGSTEG